MMKNSIQIAITMVFIMASMVLADIPRLISYQGRLADDTGGSLDGDFSIAFSIYDSAENGTELWREEWITIQSHPVTTSDGLFNVLLGTLNPIPDSVFNDSERWLEIKVESDDPITPRTQLLSVSYAYHTLRADSSTYATTIADNSVSSVKIQDGSIELVDIGQNGADSGQVMKWDGNSWVALDDSEGSGSNWLVTDSVLYTNSYWGIARGQANASLRGDSVHTAVNLGVSCITGSISEPDLAYQTVSGGWANHATGDYSTVGGGLGNYAYGNHSVVGGGQQNTASDSHATVGGGWLNKSLGDHNTVSGGRENTVIGTESFIGGGEHNRIEGNQAVISGGYGNKAGDYATVCGGTADTASGNFSTVGGGYTNKASGGGSTVGGGSFNIASGNGSTASGGSSNEAEGLNSVVGGGDNNLVSGDYSAILGGLADTITSTAAYSYLFGITSKLTEDSTFMVDMPHIRFGDEATGYEIPSEDGTFGQVMATDGAGQVSWADQAGGTGIVPVGSVTAWAKSLPSVPSLPANFVECNGQVLADPQSPFDGQTVPDLNGNASDKRFLRGSMTSGSIGGSEVHLHTQQGTGYGIGSTGNNFTDAIRGQNTATNSTLPSYYEVVWILRIK